jgi:hypothetical protein
MTDEGRPDHWADLASLLGATPLPAEPPAEKRPETAPPTTEPEQVEPPRASRTFAAPAGQRTVSDWGKLAESLGIAVPLEVHVPELVPPAVRQVARTEAVEIPPPEKVPVSPPAVALESVDAGLETIEVTDILPQGGGVPADFFSSVDTETGPVETTDRGERDRPGRRRRKRRRRARRPDDSPAAATSETPDVDLELPELAEEAESQEAESRDALQEPGDVWERSAAEPEEEGPERPRRRRRRRKRRIPGRDEQSAEAESAEGEQSEEEPLEPESPATEPWPEQREPAPEERQAAANQRGRAAEEEPSGELSDLDDDVERAAHHGIPTWEEAVGVVIAANMEARTKNPGSPRNRGGRGRGGRS